MEPWDQWDYVNGLGDAGIDVIQLTLRLKVPGGWLYLVKTKIDSVTQYEGQLVMQFVPDPELARESNDGAGATHQKSRTRQK